MKGKFQGTEEDYEPRWEHNWEEGICLKQRLMGFGMRMGRGKWATGSKLTMTARFMVGWSLGGRSI